MNIQLLQKKNQIWMFTNFFCRFFVDFLLPTWICMCGTGFQKKSDFWLISLLISWEKIESSKILEKPLLLSSELMMVCWDFTYILQKDEFAEGWNVEKSEIMLAGQFQVWRKFPEFQEVLLICREFSDNEKIWEVQKFNKIIYDH